MLFSGDPLLPKTWFTITGIQIFFSLACILCLKGGIFFTVLALILLFCVLLLHVYTFKKLYGHSVVKSVTFTLLCCFIIFATKSTYNVNPIILKIPGESMAPALMSEDYVTCDFYYYDYYPVKRGDLVIFKSLENDNIFCIKRVVGLPGERIFIKPPYVYINNERLLTDKFKDLKYNNSYRVFYTREFKEKKLSFACKAPYLVPKDSFFVIGDNSENSKDSRVYGDVPKRNIVGVCVGILFPFRRMNDLR
ncbi:signal peptidase I [Candidatus Uabimicrobium sp. HlEnr_7]|uniref:signal peptidase I n=1 Tax=Candidatus Uabimicrobium helgolandensis TaxID=3095367 RepID=UPI003558A2BB